MSKNTYDALALMSGGLDSILAARIIQEQGLKVKCIHYTSPFFGFPEKVKHWEKIYKLDITAIDISEEYAQLLKNLPLYGFGSTLNPCVDCKILMMRKTKELLSTYNAKFIISGEVLGQRPMSQRRDTLNIIKRDAEIKDILLRPLCALHLEETKPEKEGFVKRELLYAFSGRGRQEQLKLAEKFGISEIPTPAGGCKLTEKDTSARYWNVLTKHTPTGSNFHLANVGRQFWHSLNNIWLIIGRNKEDNLEIEKRATQNDLLMRVHNFPSPLALIRKKNNESIHHDALMEAASFMASYSPKAVMYAENKNFVEVFVYSQNENDKNNSNTIKLQIIPSRKSLFLETNWENSKQEVKIKMKNFEAKVY